MQINAAIKELVTAVKEQGTDIKEQGAAIKELVTAVKEQGAEAKEQRQLLGLILERLPIRSRASSAGKSPPQGGQALHSTASSSSAISNSSSAHSVK